MPGAQGEPTGEVHHIAGKHKVVGSSEAVSIHHATGAEREEAPEAGTEKVPGAGPVGAPEEEPGEALATAGRSTEAPTEKEQGRETPACG